MLNYDFTANDTMKKVGELPSIGSDTREGKEIVELITGLGLPADNDHIMFAMYAYGLGKASKAESGKEKNGFSIMAAAFRKAADMGELDPNEAEKKARIYDFLAACDTDDIYCLFDSTAFNEIAKDYMREAVKRLEGNGTIDAEQAAAVRNEFAFLFSEKTAAEISK